MHKIRVSSEEKNKNNIDFKLKNGVLFLKQKAYSGVLKTLYANGNLKSKSTYYQGKRYGVYKGWYLNGAKWFTRFYTDGLKTGTHLGWFRSGQQQFEYHFNKKGVYHGTVKDWHKNGVLAKYFNFKEGKEVGSQEMWGFDGEIRANFFTVNGERHGLIGLKKCISVLTFEKDVR